MMFCTQCGNKLGDGDRFCSSCGAKVAAGPSVAASPAAEMPTPVSACKPPTEQPPHEKPVNASSVGFDSVIRDYIAANPPDTKNVFVGSAITPSLLADYHLKPDEHPYAVVNKHNVIFNLRNYGLVITDQGIHYRALADGFFQGSAILLTKAIEGFAAWKSLLHFQVGSYDGLQTYYGHTFEINHTSIGLVRMGTGMCCDDKVTEFVNGLSAALVEAGLLKDLPTEYEWQ